MIQDFIAIYNDCSSNTWYIRVYLFIHMLILTIKLPGFISISYLGKYSCYNRFSDIMIMHNTTVPIERVCIVAAINMFSI